MRSIDFLLSIFLASIFVGCNGDTKESAPHWRTKEWAKAHEVHNQLLDVERDQGWKLLFNGRDLIGWHLYNQPDSTAFSAWTVKNGLLYCDATNALKVHGDLVTDADYGNYELVFDWRLSLRGNSGVFINVQEAPELSTAYQSGPEYQLLEPNHSDTQVANKRAGCLWGFAPQLEIVDAKPTEEWNHSRIVQKNGVLTFYLNGKRTAQEDLNSRSWKEKVETSGFSKHPHFGKTAHGKIALQHWYFDTWFRNMKIREL